MRETESQRLGRWFDAHAPRLALYARQWLDRAAAEDVVQDVFLRLISRPTDLIHERAWLFTAVRNAALGEQRSLQRRHRREQSTAARSDWFESQPGDLIDAAAAQQVLADLPEEQREVILLRIWGGLTLSEISKVMSLPVSTLFSRYRAGLAEIRKTMELSCKKKTT
jgi:RNA polymerase sigma-70 factor (ECF subfamily)